MNSHRCIEKGILSRSEKTLTVATELHCQSRLKDRGIYIFILIPVTGL